MKKASVGLAPEGYPVIGLLGLTALIFAIAGWKILALPFLVLVWFAVHFFRDPERVVPQEPGLAVSPADGKVIRIAEREDPFTGETKVCVSIFMNVFNVHVNRSPVAGKVEAIHYVPGEFFNAAWDKASKENERCAWKVAGLEGDTWVFVQIAGLVARRIVPHAEQGDELARGERIGMIRFGSRVDLFLPEGYDSTVGIGDTVFAGQSIVARKSA